MRHLIIRYFVIIIYIFTVLVNNPLSVFGYISEKDEYSSGGKISLPPEELMRRRKIVNTYLSEIGETEKDWIETYDRKFKEPKIKTPSNFDENDSNSPVNEEPNVFKEPKKASGANEDFVYETDTQSFPSHEHQKEDIFSRKPNNFKDKESTFGKVKVCHANRISDEPYMTLHTSKCEGDRLYFVRWVTKLLRKLESSGHASMCFSFSPQLIKDLKEISEDFDIVITDEMVSELISNATFYDGSYRISNMPSIDNILYYLGIMGCFLIALYTLHYCMKNHPYLTLTLLILTVFIFFHARKHYKSIIAQKHATMSRVLPQNCMNTLTSESGLFDHIRETIRLSFYHEDCKKYYEAVMIDPSDEISIPVVVADLVSSVFLQILKPLAPFMNYFVKEVSYDMSITQKLSLIPVFFFIFCIVLLLFGYKIKLPFFMGSFEPAVNRIGSRAEDLKVENSPSTPIVNVNIFPNKNNSKQGIHGNDLCISASCMSHKGEELDCSVEAKEISGIIREKGIKCSDGETVNYLCDKHDPKENCCSSDQSQINSDLDSAGSSVSVISDQNPDKNCLCAEQS